jgi:hypothetical protein
MTVAAPARFSTTTGRPSLAERWLATSRAETSEEPPGAKGTTMRRDRLGHSLCARAATGSPSAGAAASRPRSIVRRWVRIASGIASSCGLVSGALFGKVA